MYLFYGCLSLYVVLMNYTQRKHLLQIIDVCPCRFIKSKLIVYISFQNAILKFKTLSIQSIADKCWKIDHDRVQETAQRGCLSLAAVCDFTDL